METEVNLTKLKEFLSKLEEKKVHYIVIAGFGLDGKRGYQTRPHQDLDILCSKDDELKVNQAVEELGYDIKNRFHDLYKLQRDDGSKVDLCLVTKDGDYAVTQGRIAITKFPKDLFFKSQKGSIQGFEFNIAPNELLKTWGLNSQFKQDSEYVNNLPVNNNKVKKIKRIIRNN